MPSLSSVFRTFILSVCVASAAFAQTAGWSESGGVTSTPNTVAIGRPNAPFKIFTVRALTAVTGPIGSLASLGSNIVLLDASNAGENEKTAVAAAFGPNAGIPAALVFQREGTMWGTSFAFYTHDDNAATLDQLAERFHFGPHGRLTIRGVNGITGAITSLAPLRRLGIILDATNSDLNDKTGIGAAFAQSGGIPAAMIFSREGSQWGSSVGFYTHTDNAADLDQMVERVHISANGNVGIGIGATAPREMLEVAGGIYARGTISGGNVIATYQDIAEWVPSDGDLQPATVVVIDPAAENRVMPSTRAYDTAVAGVISAQPGVTLGVAGPGKEQVATTGRVRVRVDATRAPIRVGDLLVTGDAPGTAMRSEPLQVGGVAMHRPGTVIGKALQPLERGQGEILVLLSLQ